LGIATGPAPIIAEITEGSSSQKLDYLLNADIRVVHRLGKPEAGCRSCESASGIRALLRTIGAAFVRSGSGPVLRLVNVPLRVPPNMQLTRP
jgi:hypothetical protein